MSLLIGKRALMLLKTCVGTQLYLKTIPQKMFFRAPSLLNNSKQAHTKTRNELARLKRVAGHSKVSSERLLKYSIDIIVKIFLDFIHKTEIRLGDIE